MSKVSYGKLLEEQLRELSESQFCVKISGKNEWLIQQIESVVNEHPEIKRLNFLRLTYDDIVSLIESCIDKVDVNYNEEFDVITLIPCETKAFLSRKEFIVLFLLCTFGGINLFQFFWSRRKIESIKYQDVDYFDDVFYNSAVTLEPKNNFYRFVTSIYSSFHYIYFLQDDFINSLKATPTKNSSYKDINLSKYIQLKHQNRNNINDPFLDSYIDGLFKKSQKNRNKF